MTDANYPTLKETRWGHIISILERTGWNIKEASGLLKVTERFLRSEIRKMGRGEARRREKDRKETIQRKNNLEDL